MDYSKLILQLLDEQARLDECIAVFERLVVIKGLHGSTIPRWLASIRATVKVARRPHSRKGIR